ncbi:MAG: metalloregulator ArsR/SmtB family transcription factor [Chitinophagales bacterium]|nr:metalloregulator ArsR/SmtB family transcription factor [Chitinophagales bacterium]
MSYIQFDKNTVKVSSDILRALAHDLRLRMFYLIQEAGEINVNDIYTTLKLEQSITSQHLSVLRKTDIVNTTRRGKMIFYSINKGKVKIIFDAIENFEEKSQIRKNKEAEVKKRA